MNMQKVIAELRASADELEQLERGASAADMVDELKPEIEQLEARLAAHEEAWNRLDTLCDFTPQENIEYASALRFVRRKIKTLRPGAEDTP